MQNIHGFMVYSFNTFPCYGWKDKLEREQEAVQHKASEGNSGWLVGFQSCDSDKG